MGQTSPFRGEGRKVRNRRVSPVEAHSGDRLLSQHIAGIQPCRREPLFVPRNGHWCQDRAYGEMEVVEGGHRAAAGLLRGNLIEYFVLAPQRTNYPQ